MKDWTSGYVTDVGYTFGYCTELNPTRARLAFINAGLVPPESGTHCELGFGQGISANIHAAACAGTWYATDFNPAQAGFAKSLARASGADANLYDQAFSEFCLRDDLPQFDSIGMHGIWSWISDENRAVIVDFIGRKLKVGGVLYLSYNTQPGWATFSPMRHLLTQQAEVMGAAGLGMVKRIDGALDFAEKLLKLDPRYLKANPSVMEGLTKAKAKDRHYLAHEYFNHDWQPMHFATVANWLRPAKIEFACSAHYLDHIDLLNLSAEQHALLHEIPDAMFRQTVRDFMVNQSFRRDYWVKGARQLNPLERFEALGAQRVILLTPRADVLLKISGELVQATLQEAIYGPILDVLADHKPHTLAQLELTVREKGIGLAQISQAIIILIGVGYVATVQEDALISNAQVQTRKLNAHLLDKVRGSDEFGYLASPVIGAGFRLDRVQRLFLLAMAQGKRQPADWAQVVWSTLASQGQTLVLDGKTLDSAEDNMAELIEQARLFDTKLLPIVKALQIA